MIFESREEIISRSDLYDPNKLMKMPVCICVDISGYMKNYERDVERELNSFINRIKEDDFLRYSAEIGVVAYAESCDLLRDFKTLDSMEGTLRLKVLGGKANLGTAVMESIRLLKKKKSDYRESFHNYRQPNLLLLSSGEADDDIEKASRVATEMQKNKILSVIPILVGDSPRADIVKKFSVDGNVMYGGELKKLANVLNCIGESMERLSKSTVSAYGNIKDNIVEWEKYKV